MDQMTARRWADKVEMMAGRTAGLLAAMMVAMMVDPMAAMTVKLMAVLLVA